MERLTCTYESKRGLRRLGTAFSAATRVALCLLLFGGAPIFASEDPRVVRVSEHLDKQGNRIDDRLEERFKPSRAGGVSTIVDEPVELIITTNGIPLSSIRSAIRDSGGVVHRVWTKALYGLHVEMSYLKAVELAEAYPDVVTYVMEPQKTEALLEFSTRQIRTQPAWNGQYTSGIPVDGSSETVVAIIDTGLDSSHSDVDMVVWENFVTHDFVEVPSGWDAGHHGTHVGTTAAGSGAASGNSDYNFTLSAGLFVGQNQYATDFMGVPVRVQGEMRPMTVDLEWDSAGEAALRILDENDVIVPGSEVTGESPLSVTILLEDTEGLYTIQYAALSFENTFSEVRYYVSAPYVNDFSGNLLRGVAPGCPLAGLRVLDDTGSGTSIAILNALEWLIENAAEENIVVGNMSLGMNGSDPTVNTATDNVVRAGIFMAVAAGNSQGMFYVGSPGLSPLATTVASVNSENAIAYYSSTGSPFEEVIKPDVAAPGGSYEHGDLITAGDSNDGDETFFFNRIEDGRFSDYVMFQGTSMASPHVAGLAALIIDARRDPWTYGVPDDPLWVKMIMCMTAFETQAAEEEDLTEMLGMTLGRAAQLKDPVEGYGRVCADACVEAAALLFDPETAPTETSFFGAEPEDKKVWARRIRMDGETILQVDMDTPEQGDFDLYVYEGKPDSIGQPILHQASDNTEMGADEQVFIDSTQEVVPTDYYIVAKWVAGEGSFSITTKEVGFIPGQRASIPQDVLIPPFSPRRAVAGIDVSDDTGQTALWKVKVRFRQIPNETGGDFIPTEDLMPLGVDDLSGVAIYRDGQGPTEGDFDFSEESLSASDQLLVPVAVSDFVKSGTDTFDVEFTFDSFNDTATLVPVSNDSRFDYFVVIRTSGEISHDDRFQVTLAPSGVVGKTRAGAGSGLNFFEEKGYLTEQPEEPKTIFCEIITLTNLVQHLQTLNSEIVEDGAGATAFFGGASHRAAQPIDRNSAAEVVGINAYGPAKENYVLSKVTATITSLVYGDFVFSGAVGDPATFVPASDAEKFDFSDLAPLVNSKQSALALYRDAPGGEDGVFEAEVDEYIPLKESSLAVNKLSSGRWRASLEVDLELAGNRARIPADDEARHGNRGADFFLVVRTGDKMRSEDAFVVTIEDIDGVGAVEITNGQGSVFESRRELVADPFDPRPTKRGHPLICRPSPSFDFIDLIALEGESQLVLPKSSLPRAVMSVDLNSHGADTFEGSDGDRWSVLPNELKVDFLNISSDMDFTTSDLRSLISGHSFDNVKSHLAGGVMLYWDDSTPTGDLVDNDNDGLIDEELLDNMDNDGDGLVDEDVGDGDPAGINGEFDVYDDYLPFIGGCQTGDCLPGTSNYAITPTFEPLVGENGFRVTFKLIWNVIGECNSYDSNDGRRILAHQPMIGPDATNLGVPNINTRRSDPTGCSCLGTTIFGFETRQDGSGTFSVICSEEFDDDTVLSFFAPNSYDYSYTIPIPPDNFSDGPNVGADMFVVVRTSELATHGDDFRVRIPADGLTWYWSEQIIGPLSGSGNLGFDPGISNDTITGGIVTVNAPINVCLSDTTRSNQKIDALLDGELPLQVLSIDADVKSPMAGFNLFGPSEESLTELTLQFEDRTDRSICPDGGFVVDASSERSDLQPFIANSSAGGVTVWADDGFSEGIFDPGDSLVFLKGAPTVTQDEKNPGIYRVRLVFREPQPVPYMNAGPEAGADYHVAIRTSKNLSYRDAFRIKLDHRDIEGTAPVEARDQCLGLLVTNTIRANVPTFLEDVTEQEGSLTGSPVSLSRLAQQQSRAVIGLDMADCGTIFNASFEGVPNPHPLANVDLERLEFVLEDVQGFALGALAPLSNDETSGVSLYRDNPNVGLGIDDDGDGLTDEEIIDGLDNDGDGRIDEDFSDFEPRGIFDISDVFTPVDLNLSTLDHDGGALFFRPNQAPVPDASPTVDSVRSATDAFNDYFLVLRGAEDAVPDQMFRVTIPSGGVQYSEDVSGETVTSRVLQTTLASLPPTILVSEPDENGESTVNGAFTIVVDASDPDTERLEMPESPVVRLYYQIVPESATPTILPGRAVVPIPKARYQLAPGVGAWRVEHVLRLSSVDELSDGTPELIRIIGMIDDGYSDRVYSVSPGTIDTGETSEEEPLSVEIVDINDALLPLQLQTDIVWRTTNGQSGDTTTLLYVEELPGDRLTAADLESNGAPRESYKQEFLQKKGREPHFGVIASNLDADVAGNVRTPWDYSGLDGGFYRVVGVVSRQGSPKDRDVSDELLEVPEGIRFPISHSEGFEAGPAVADLTGDGSLEVVVLTREPARVYVYDVEGIQLCRSDLNTPGTSDPSSVGQGTPALGDIDGDGSLEIVVAALNGDDRTAYLHVLSISEDRGLVERFGGPLKVSTSGEAVIASPVIADLVGPRTGTVFQEIVVGTIEHDGPGILLGRMSLVGLDETGALETKATVDFDGKIQATPAVGWLSSDLASPSVPEVVLNVDDGMIYGVTFPEAYSAPLSGTVETSVRSIFDLKKENEASLNPPSAPVLFDVDGDGSDEIFVGSLDGRFYGLRADGTSLLGEDGEGEAIPIFELPTTDVNGYDLFDYEREIRASAALGRVDDDEDLDIVFAGANNILYAFEALVEDGSPVFASLFNAPNGEPGIYDPRTIGSRKAVFRRSSPIIGPLTSSTGSNVLIGSHQGDVFVASAGSTALQDLISKPPLVGRFVSSFTLADVDRDGINDLVYTAVGAEGGGVLDILRNSDYVGGEADWGTYRHDATRSGRFQGFVLPTGDLDGDRNVDYVDLFLLVVKWGHPAETPFKATAPSTRKDSSALLRMILEIRGR